jgi:hypothetical protein
VYQLSDFIPFKGNEHKVLAWSKKSGYYFTEVDFTKSELCVDVLIVAIEEV